MFVESVRATLLEVALLGTVFCIAIALEKFFRRDKVYPKGEIRLNLAAMAIDTFALAFIIMPLVLQLSAKITSMAPWQKIHVTPDSITLPLFIAGAFFLNDFFYYWFHRALHQVNFLWALHKFHHVEQHMNVTTAARIQLIEEFVQQFLVALPLGLIVDLSCIPRGVAMAIGVLIYLQHIDLPLSWGRYSHVLSSPYYHCIHHSRELRHRNKNFAVVLPLWDIIFGTHYAAAQREFPPSGVRENDAYYSRMTALFLPKAVSTLLARIASKVRGIMVTRQVAGGD